MRFLVLNRSFLLFRRHLPHRENRAFRNQPLATQIVVPCIGFRYDGDKRQRQRRQEEVDRGPGEVVGMALSVQDHDGDGGDHQDDASDVDAQGERWP